MDRPNIELLATVDDLRVISCFACHRHHAPHKPLRIWKNPCACTLVAHESCFLRWIDEAQATNALNCPQCKITYELVNSQWRILRLLSLGRLHCSGRIVMLGIYATATIYGSWAVKQFLGAEMQALLVPDDPAAWRWTTFITLPGIPFALILDRFNFPTRYMTLFMISILPTRTAFGFILVLLARYVYRKAWTSLQIRILGYAPPSVCNINNTVVWDEWPVRIERQVDDDGVVRQGQVHGRNQTVLVRRYSLVRYIGSNLLAPWISSCMGAFLLAVSNRSKILRLILAVEPQGQGTLGQLPRILGMISNTRGSSMWLEPVWWRNVLGLGLFVFVKDMTELLHDAQVAVL
ncbi:hypothetical protein E4T56_gene5179 [Termitomyces sp. T112]|nr:hypothetical protein E4T56_gene5179 [Termitomyces sp. T112]